MKLIILTLCLLVLLSVTYGFSFSTAPKSIQTIRSSLVMRERKCDVTGKRRNAKCNNVSKSNAHTRKIQNVNLQTRKLFWEEGNKMVKLRISTKTLKTIEKNGLDATAKKYGINLNKHSISYGSAAKKETTNA